MDAYHLITINGKELIEALIQQQHAAKNGNQELKKLTVNLRHSPQVIKTIAEFDDNGLFYQLAEIAGTGASDWTWDSLLHKIVFIDFSGVFSNSMQSDKKQNTVQAEKAKQKEDILQRLFLDPKAFKADGRNDSIDDGGLFIDFDGDDQLVRFVPFDKSGSMSRTSRTSFIDSRLKEQVDHRLLLDLAFGLIQTSPSKLYAYRGLYLSAGKRITANDNLKLSEETVIVISDYEQPIAPPIQLFGEVKESTDVEEDLNNKLWKLKTYTEERHNAIKTLPFDGEGLPWNMRKRSTSSSVVGMAMLNGIRRRSEIRTQRRRTNVSEENTKTEKTRFVRPHLHFRFVCPSPRVFCTLSISPDFWRNLFLSQRTSPFILKTASVSSAIFGKQRLF